MGLRYTLFLGPPISIVYMVPNGPGKMGDYFPVREKSENFAKTGKVREFYPKYWENREILTLENGNKYWKSQRNLAVRKVKTMEIGCHTFKKI